MGLNTKLYNRRRRRLGITHAEVARRIGVDRVSVMRWLSGRHDPTLNHLLALARVLRLPPGKLLKNDGIIINKKSS